VSTTDAILDPSYRGVLTEYALANVLVAFDYDGTLAPIAPTPEEARMRATTRRLLRLVARRYPTVVISGRTLDDLSHRLRSVPLWHIFGNHGLEFSFDSEPSVHVRGWVDQLTRELPTDLGIAIEDKTHSVTLHFRGVPNRRQALKAIERALQHLPDVTVLGGKEAVNLLPRGRGNKGAALQYAIAACACTHAIYVGDDDTDEDAFTARIQNDFLLPIRVGLAEPTRARYHLIGQDDVDLFLKVLLDVRQNDGSQIAGAEEPGDPTGE
jgi:trehalose 6-phosphate phosphatase